MNNNNESFKKAYKEVFSIDAFKEALDKDCQRLFEAYVENNSTDVAYEAHFNPDNFLQSSVEEALKDGFCAENEKVNSNELEETFDFLNEVLTRIMDEDEVDDEVLDGFGNYVVHEIHPAYTSVKEYYVDQGEFVTTKDIKSSIAEELETMKDWENESKEFTPNYGREW